MSSVRPPSTRGRTGGRAAPGAGAGRVPWRRTLGLIGGVTGLAAIVGVIQLLTGTFTPPVSDLAPVGLHSWVLPGLWLAASVTLPCACVALLAWRASPRTGGAAIVAGALLAIELVVQIPVIGPDALQAVMGGVAAALIGFGLASRKHRHSHAPGRAFRP